MTFHIWNVAWQISFVAFQIRSVACEDKSSS
jgi:hypothetical protein